MLVVHAARWAKIAALRSFPGFGAGVRNRVHSLHNTDASCSIIERDAALVHHPRGVEAASNMLVEPHPTRVRTLFWLGRPLSGSGPRRQEVNATYPHQPPTSSDNEMTRAIAKRTVVERVRPCGVVIDLPSPARESSRELLEKLFSPSSAHTGHVAAARHVMQQMKTRDRASSERGAGVAAVVPAGAAVVGHPAGKPMGSPCATARVASPARQPTKPSPPNISERAIGLCPLNFVERAIGPWLHNYLRHPNPASRKMFGNPFSESSEGSTPS